MILSFAHTTEQFLSGEKTVTRRDWKDRHLKSWQRAWDQGRLVHDAYDKVPRAGGKKIGEFKLTARPYLEMLKDIPEADLAAEGFGDVFYTVQEFIDFMNADPHELFAVIRFEKL